MVPLVWLIPFLVICEWFGKKESLHMDGLGLNSISYIELLVEIEHKYDVTFTEEEYRVGTFDNISHLLACVFNKFQLNKEV